MSAQKQYTNELKRKFGYYATWNPGVQLKLGDIGTLKGNIFTRISNVNKLAIQFETRPDLTKTTLEHYSQGSVSVTTKLQGGKPLPGSILEEMDAGIIVEFNKAFATLFKANNVTCPSVEDTITMGNEILALYKAGKWDKKWVVITELLEAESASILISNSGNGKIELKANTKMKSPGFDIADAGFNFSVQFARGMETQIVANEGLTPLFKLMGIKTRLFVPPAFTTESIRGIDTITPESAKKEHEDAIYFGYISSDIRE
jgi:hypothetical protein